MIKQGWWMGVAPLHMQTFTLSGHWPRTREWSQFKSFVCNLPCFVWFCIRSWVSEWVKLLSRVSLQPHGCSLPGSSIHGIFQAGVLEWGAIAFFRGSSQPRDWTQVSRIIGRHFTIWVTREILVSDLSCWVKIYQGTAFVLVLVYFSKVPPSFYLFLGLMLFCDWIIWSMKPSNWYKTHDNLLDIITGEK